MSFGKIEKCFHRASASDFHELFWLRRGKWKRKMQRKNSQWSRASVLKLVPNFEFEFVTFQVCDRSGGEQFSNTRCKVKKNCYEVIAYICGLHPCRTWTSCGPISFKRAFSDIKMSYWSQRCSSRKKRNAHVNAHLFKSKQFKLKTLTACGRNDVQARHHV